MCLSKEIPRIRNAILDVQNISQMELTGLKKEILQMRTLYEERINSLEEKLSQVATI